MSFCPNKSSKEYKALVSQFGEAGAYSAWFQANKVLLSEENSNVEPNIPSVEQASQLLAGRMFNVQNKEFNSFEAELADINKKYPNFNQPYDVLKKIAKAINSTYKYLKASIVQSEVGDLTDHTIRIEKVIQGSIINGEVLSKLQKLFPKTKLQGISSATAINMVGDLARKSPTFILNDTVYVIEDRVTDETLIEEFLHPFIQYIYSNNKELFDNLYEDAKNDKALLKSIAQRYTNFTVADKKKEMVTQKLAELLHRNYFTSKPNTIEGITVQMKKLFGELVKFFQKWLGGNMLEVEAIPASMDLGQLANLLNTTGLEAPVEYLAAPTFSLMDDISNQSRDNGYRLQGESYEDNKGVKYSRLTEWIRNTLGNGKGKTAVDFAKNVAQNMFNKYSPYLKDGVQVIKLEDGSELSLDQLTEKVLIDFETSKAYGTLAHLLIERAIKKAMGIDTSALTIKIDTLSEGNATQNPIDLYKMDWIEKNIQPILQRAGITALDERFDQAQRDKILSEIPYILEQLGIGTTIDGLIFHTDGTMSIKDWKTGRLLSDQFTSVIFGEFGNQVQDIYDSKLDRAKLEVVLRALMIKYKNPTAIFRQLSIEHLNKNSLVESYNIDIYSYLKVLEDHFQKYNPEIYNDLKSKGLFNSASYGVKIHEDLNKAYEDKESTLKSLDERIEILKNTITKEVRSDKKAILNGQLKELTRERLETESTMPSGFTNGSEGVSWFKRHFGNLSNISNDLINTFKKILDKATMAFNLEKSQLFDEFDKLTKELMDAHGTNWQNIGLNYTNKSGTGLYDFMFIEKDKGNNVGMYRVTKNDAKYNTLTDVQKRYLDFFNDKLSGLYNEVASQVVATDYSGDVTNAEFNKQPKTLPEDFFPRVYMSMAEYAGREGVSKNLLKFKYYQFKHQFLKSEFYANNATEAIPFKFMGSDATIGSKMHTFNGEIAFKEFANNLLRKKHLDKVQSIGVGLAKTFYDEDDHRTAAFLEDRILIEVLDMKKKTEYSKKAFSIVKGGKKYKVDIDTILDTGKAFITAGTMWLKPFAGLRNGVYTIATNHKNSVIGSISKRFGIKEEDLNFTESEMAKADALWSQYQLDILRGKGNENKLNLLLKKYNYLPEAYDYNVHPTNILSKSNKILNSDHLYFFHSVFEDWGTGTIFTALLLHNKNQVTGKSLLDSYEVKDGKLEWVGGVRGKRADGSEINEITYEELNKFKKVSSAIHGNYRKDERAAIELYALGRLAMQFKRFVPQQMMNLGQSSQLSDAYGKFVELVDENGKVRKDKDGISLYQWTPEVIEGKYRLMWGHLLNVVNMGTGNYQWDKLGPKQKQDLISSYVIIMGSILGFVLGKSMIPDDDEDKWLAVSYYKILKDLSEGADPLDMIENFQYQSVAGYKLFKMSKAAGEFFFSVATGKKNKYGRYKQGNELAKAIPPFSTIYDIDKAFNRTQKGKNIGFNLINLGKWGEDLNAEDLKIDLKNSWAEGK